MRCPHAKIKVVAKVRDKPEGIGFSRQEVWVSGVCTQCREPIRFVGLPSALARDAPSGDGSEDDGIDNRVCRLPFVLRDR